MMILSPSKLKKFSSWLQLQGAEMLQPTNEYELVRFRCKDGIGVLYEGKRGQSVSSSIVTEAIRAFIDGKQWKAKPQGTKRLDHPYTSQKKKQLHARDGDCCFYCGKPLGDDVTLEHILSLIHKGSNRLENMALAHSECNSKAGNLSIVDKIKLRDELRGD